MKKFTNYKQKTVEDLCFGASDWDLNKFEDIILDEKNKRVKLKK